MVMITTQWRIMEFLIVTLFMGVMLFTAWVCMAEVAVKKVSWLMAFLTLCCVVGSVMTYGKPIQGAFVFGAIILGACTLILRVCSS